MVGGGGGDGHIVEDGVQHHSMESAPEIAKDVAEAMAKAAPKLEETLVAGGDSFEEGEIIVVSHPGSDPKVACLLALAMVETAEEEHSDECPAIHGCATLDEKIWNEYLTCGFNDNSDDPDAGLLAITSIMSKKLERHFQFSFTEDVGVAPIIYGGYTSDGSIVGVLSARAW